MIKTQLNQLVNKGLDDLAVTIQHRLALTFNGYTKESNGRSDEPQPDHESDRDSKRPEATNPEKETTAGNPEIRAATHSHMASPAKNVTPPSLDLLERELTAEEYLVLMIALAPHIQPDFFDRIIQDQLPKAGDFPQLGGVRGKQFRGFLPTGETALFILAGNNMEEKFAAQQIFSEDHFFAKKRILWLEDPPSGEPAMSGKIVMSSEYIDLLTIGRISRPKFGIKFPAQLIETGLEWEDLILSDNTMSQIHDLENWINHGDTLLYRWGMSERIKPGYRVLFCGPPGTGKTLAATLLGKYTGKDVYKIDLSMIISKFIGETEKNLSNLFANAENHDWILFFDEADALFGKRTNVRDAHDKYANQEVSYLLQRVETYKGLVILASNFRDNIDEAFIRRFQSIIYFPKPKKKERLKIWEQAFPDNIEFEEGLDLKHIADEFELTGANIVNVVQQVCLKALATGSHRISDESLESGIRRELAKEGKML